MNTMQTFIDSNGAILNVLVIISYLIVLFCFGVAINKSSYNLYMNIKNHKEKTRLLPNQLPAKALELMSVRQKSYIDEFRFFQIPKDIIECWYGSELLLLYYDGTWHEPKIIKC